MIEDKLHDVFVEINNLIDSHNERRVAFLDCYRENCRICGKIRKIAAKHLGARETMKNGRAMSLYDARRRARECDPKQNTLVKMGYTPERYKTERLTMFPDDEKLRAHYHVSGQALWGFKMIYNLRGPFVKNKYPQLTKKAYLKVVKLTKTDVEAAKLIGCSLPALRARKRKWGLTGGKVHAR